MRLPAVRSVRSLQGAPVALTGGGRGIGRAIAVALARAGARVAIGDVDVEAAETVAREIGADAFASALDVTGPERFRAFLDEAEGRHGPLALLVNNAGVDWIGPFHEEPDEVTRREIEVNLYGTALGSKLALARMLPRREGHIVNVASAAGRVPLPGTSMYSATKHGVVGLTESLRLEYRGSGVGFTVVQPAQVETAMLEGQARPRALPVVAPEEVAAAGSTPSDDGASRFGCRARRRPRGSSRPSCRARLARRSCTRWECTESPAAPTVMLAAPTTGAPSGATEDRGPGPRVVALRFCE